MASTEPDLSLPERIPSSELTDGEDVMTIALYALCTISDEQLESYRQKCASEIEDEDVQLPSRAHFPSQPLGSIVDYHLELARGGIFHPTNFIVCVYPTASTALIVTLNDWSLPDWEPENDAKPDLMWVPVQISGSLIGNLNIANTDWSELSAGEDNVGGPSWDDLESREAKDLYPLNELDGSRTPENGQSH